MREMIGACRSGLCGAAARLARAEEGGVAIEYALIAAFIGAAVSAFIWGTGDAMMSGYYDRLMDLFS